MPKEETFFEERRGDATIEVLKSYDRNYAHEVLARMGGAALRHLWDALRPEDIYELEALPSLGDVSGEAETFLWDELLEQAREERTLLSFLIVNERDGNHREGLYVSPDWPSAKSYAEARLNQQTPH